MNQIQERLTALRKEMSQRDIDVYMIPTSDFHETEYAGEHFKARHWMSNFSGSAGTLVVTRKEAGLWTDGRYFIQAERELKDTGIQLMKMGMENTPLMEDYILDHLEAGHALGFDGRVVNTGLAEKLKDKIAAKHGILHSDEDLVGLIWKDRPALPKEPAFTLDIAYCGESTTSKLSRLRKWMSEHEVDTHIVTTLDDIAWILNMRGNDISGFPVSFAYLIVEMDRVTCFIDQSKLNEEMRKRFAKEGVSVDDYEAIFNAVEKLNSNARILMDKGTVNYRITQALPSTVTITDERNPSQLWKAIKNDVELQNDRIAHIKDGVAVTKFMYWLKQNINTMTITEYSAAEKLAQYRSELEHWIDCSFGTISAYNENAAMMHYQANADNAATLRPEGFLLVDSGGQYFEGTTDITRTFVLGSISDRQRRHFTNVLRGMMNLSRAKFLYGCRGMNLDILARQPMWSEDLDYQCGTGHGVGFVLNVHEGPNGFRWKMVPERTDNAVLEAGMVTTIEPGIYLEGEYGIRTENELICRKGIKNEYGQFMEFETITFAPIDLDGVDPALLSNDEKAWLNSYHQEVYEKISPYLNDDERKWLKEYTRAI